MKSRLKNRHTSCSQLFNYGCCFSLLQKLTNESMNFIFTGHAYATCNSCYHNHNLVIHFVRLFHLKTKIGNYHVHFTFQLSGVALTIALASVWDALNVSIL